MNTYMDTYTSTHPETHMETHMDTHMDIHVHTDNIQLSYNQKTAEVPYILLHNLVLITDHDNVLCI